MKRGGRDIQGGRENGGRERDRERGRRERREERTSLDCKKTTAPHCAGQGDRKALVCILGVLQIKAHHA